MGLAKKNSFRKFSADSVQDRILFGHSRMFSMCSLVCLLLWELLVVHGDGNIDPRERLSVSADLARNYDSSQDSRFRSPESYSV